MDNKKVTQISSIELKNFRCFSHLKIDFSASHILLEGVNGIGKTSILEALYYACYLRSFRTNSPRELISFNEKELFLKINIHSSDGLSHAIQIGLSPHKRLVKVDQRAITSYKELMSYYRIISITEDDLSLIQGSPQFRRLFLDQMLLLLHPEEGRVFKEYRQIVDQRNAYLQSKKVNEDTYRAFTYQQWKQALYIEKKRRDLLGELSLVVNDLNQKFISTPYELLFSYRSKQKLYEEFELFYAEIHQFREKEYRYGRSFFGVHLDDISISIKNRHSRLYASRGEQKMVLLLLKIAQLQILKKMGRPTIFLLDDFMTDFDEKHAQELFSALNGLVTQLIFTAPIRGGVIAQKIKRGGGQVVKLTI